MKGCTIHISTLANDLGNPGASFILHVSNFKYSLYLPIFECNVYSDTALFNLRLYYSGASLYGHSHTKYNPIMLGYKLFFLLTENSSIFSFIRGFLCHPNEGLQSYKFNLV